MTTKPPQIFSVGATPRDNDIVIALMGMTGSGKSSLISLCTDQEIKIGHELESCTQDVETYVFNHPTLRFGRVYLVDTPGFDDTNRKDTEILRTLGAWLTATYSSGIKLSGIIYCHRINQTRMQGSAMKNIQLFRSLCGDDALSKVVLVTTMWDIEKLDIAERREKELKETTKYWGSMVAKGSRVLRHYNTQQSAFALIETFVKDDSKIVLGIQKEMVNDQKPLDKSEAGKDIKALLDGQNASLRSDIQNLEFELREALRTKDEELAEVMRELRLEHKQSLQQVLDNQQKLQATMQQLHESKYAELEAKLEEERQKWRPQIPPQFPDGVPGSSAIKAHQPTGAYQPSKTPSPHPPENAQILYLGKRKRASKHELDSNASLRISPDGSRIAIIKTSKTVILATDTGTEIGCYTNPENFYSSPGMRGTFFPDGESLALWGGTVTIYKTIPGRSDVQKWYTLDEPTGYGFAISKDFKTTADTLAHTDPIGQEVVLTSFVTGMSHKLDWTTPSTFLSLDTGTCLFAKHDEILVFGVQQCVSFFGTGSRRLLRTEWISGPPKSDHIRKSRLVLSGDTLLLGVLVHDALSSDIRVYAKFFRLSGMVPEIVSTFLGREVCHFILEGQVSLSFDGCYFAYFSETRLSIVHVMSGVEVLSENVDEHIRFLSFFPSDNRLVWLTSKGSFSVVRLVT